MHDYQESASSQDHWLGETSLQCPRRQMCGDSADQLEGRGLLFKKAFQELRKKNNFGKNSSRHINNMRSIKNHLKIITKNMAVSSTLFQRVDAKLLKISFKLI